MNSIGIVDTHILHSKLHGENNSVCEDIIWSEKYLEDLKIYVSLIIEKNRLLEESILRNIEVVSIVMASILIPLILHILKKNEIKRNKTWELFNKFHSKEFFRVRV